MAEPQDPTFYQPIKKEIPPLAGLNKYERKQRRPPSNLYEIKESNIGSTQMRFYQSYKQGNVFAPPTAKFIGSGGYQRMLGNDFTFNHMEKGQKTLTTINSNGVREDLSPLNLSIPSSINTAT